tara:strand:- start:613 stop:933 length:321 start_codon:yes stop_codon:yes gene_type:complete
MITLIHILFDALIYLLINIFKLTSFNFLDLILLFSASLIDLDHLTAKPIYHPRRNPFKIHFLHRNWVFVLLAGIIMLFIRPVLFLGIGLISHLFLDLVYVKRCGFI